MDLKERISEVIAYSQFSLSEFADEIEVQRSSISHITSGRNKPSLDFLMKIKSRFPELEWEWLIEGRGEMLKNGDLAANNLETPPKSKTASLPDLFSLINDESFGVTESEDKVAPQFLPESNISAQGEKKNQISDSQRLASEEVSQPRAAPGSPQSNVKRIVLFYENGKFETFEP
jgi:transcriptional regulator with XRE-family HTH domain